MRRTRLKQGDPVVVTAGNDKGKEGKLLAIRGDRVVVQGVNRKKRHQRAREEGKKGAIVTIEAPLHISNISYSAAGAPVKLRARITAEKKTEIFYRTKSNEEKVVRTV